MIEINVKIYCVLSLAALSSLAVASDFASTLVSWQGQFGSYPYNDPNAVLGQPTTEVYDNDWVIQIMKVSLVYAAWNVTPEGTPTVLTLEPGAEIVVGFDHKVADDINNPFGIDFIVFGNSFFKRQGGVLTPATDMDMVYLANPAFISDDWIIVSVAQDPNGPWYRFPDGIAAGGLFPTNPFAWDSVNKTWGEPLDFLKPVDPNLSLADFSGLSVPQAIALYDGSAGGAGFDLRRLDPEDYNALRIDPETGRKWIQYIKLSVTEYGGSGQIDAVADVAACGDYRHPFPPGDINRDCRVDLADFAVLAENWTVCTWNCDP